MVPLPAQRHPIFFRPRCLRLIQRLLKTYEPKIGGMQVFWDTVYFLFHDPYWASVLTLSCYNLVTEAPVVESPLEPASQISRWSWILVEILKLGLVKILNFKFSGVADVKLTFLVDAYSRDSEDEMWPRFVFELVIWLQEITLARWTQPSGPLCLWQCFRNRRVFPRLVSDKWQG